MTRAYALSLLLALPDEPCMRRRAHRYTCGRMPLRSADVIKRDLCTAYVAHRQQDFGVDISCVVSVRRQPLKIVRRA